MEKRTVAFTQRANDIRTKLTTKLNISSKYSKNLPNKKFEVMAQWDTGASMSAISKDLVKALELPTVSMTKMGTAGGIIDSTIHIIDVELPNGDVIPDLRVVSGNLVASPMLIGMDIISRGDFAISNFKGKTKINFRIPSYCDIDFVEMAKNTNQKKRGTKTQRNDKCPCGSGRKYKNCCGK